MSLQQILFEQDEGNISARVAQFEELAKVAAEMSEHLSDGRAPPPDRLEISSHLYQAFMSAVIFVAGFQPKESHTYQYHRYLKECTSRINKGMTQLVNHFCTADLSEQEAVLPVGIMALVIRSVHQDITYSQPDLLYRAYKEYLNRLVSLQRQSSSFSPRITNHFRRNVFEQIQRIEIIKSRLSM